MHETAQAAPPPVPGEAASIFRLEGEYWTIAYGSDLCRLRDTAGLRYIAYLLDHPGERIAAGQLVDSAGPGLRSVARRDQTGSRPNPTSAAARLTHSTDPYKLVNGTLVANNWTDLTDGTIAAPINVTETGAAASSTTITVLTGTNEFGGVQDATATCSDWTSASSAQSGWFGITASTVFDWTKRNAGGCSANYSLYCIQQ
jgi:hypothetical protein